jgi:co-chaperonin GroES (HSP10)
MHMATRNNSLTLQIALLLTALSPLACWPSDQVLAQAPTAVSAPATSQMGTIKAVSGNTLTMASDKGAIINVTVAEGARLLQLAVGSKDLKTATPSQLSDIAVGDRALVTGAAGDAPGTFTARRVILMKSSDIAQMQADQQADWKDHGTGGIVSAIDPSTGTITIAAGTKKIAINTSSKTIFRRFASDSAKYQDAKPSMLAEIQPKDHLQARGITSADGASMQAEEVISGSFENLSGELLSVDAVTGNITLKDLATKKVVTVNVTANSNIRALPPQMAARFAAQSNGGGQAAGGGSGTRSSAASDLSQVIGRLPSAALADLHKGDAVMIVASAPMVNSSVITAITLLTGVDPILTANPNGGMNLSMSMGGGGGTGE